LLGSFTCRKAGTWDRYFYFPSEGRHAEDFYTRKDPAASAGFEPANSGTRSQHANLLTAVILSVQITAARHAIKTDCRVGVGAVGNTCCDFLLMVGDPASKSDNTVFSRMQV
jgi:hypothetical protein